MSRALALVAILGVAVPVSAQQIDKTPVADDIRVQVQMFELSLQGAVRRGAKTLADRARQVEPGVSLMFATDPIVRGVFLPEYGAVFDVQVPEIMDSSLELLRIMASRGLPPGMRPTDPGKVNAAGTAIVTPDPTFVPDKEYGVYTRQALIDAWRCPFRKTRCS
jgi:hypothetical protein